METATLVPSQSPAALRLEAAGEAPDARRAQIRAAAEEYEGLFLAQMMAPMFENLGGGLFGGGPGEAVYRSMMVEQYGKSIARSGGIGIADAVEREILKLQEIEQ